MSRSLDTQNLAKEILGACVKAAIPSQLLASVVGVGVDELLKTFMPSPQRRSIVEELARDLVRQLMARAESMPKNQGAARSAAYDVAKLIHNADLSFDRLREFDFDPMKLKGYILRNPPDELAGNMRRQLWDWAIEQFCIRLMSFYLNDQMFQTQMLMVIYRQQAEMLQALTLLPIGKK